MKQFLIFCCILLCTASLGAAGSVSFTDPLNAYEYTVYDSDGDLLGVYNTTNDSFVLNSTGDYQIFVRPNTVSIIEDPTVMFDWTLTYIPLVIGSFAILVFAVAMYALYKRAV